MMAHTKWPRAVISDVCEAIIDCVNKTAPVVDKPTPYKMIRTTNVRSGWVTLDEVKYVTEDTYKIWTRRQVPRRGDVILTREAPLGEVGMLRTDEPVFLGQRLVSYRTNPQKLNNRFLLYAFQEDDLQGQIRALASGATVEHMRVPDAEKLTLRLPPLSIQHRIADILSAYDDLIGNNTKRIKILEEMARSLYREWFVQFRFPGHERVKLVDSPMGKVPHRWDARPLAEFVEVNGRTIRRGQEPPVVDYVDISSVSPGIIEQTQRYAFKDAPGRARRLVQHGDTIWSMVRPSHRAHALIFDPPPSMVVSTGFAVLTPRRISSAFLYLATTTDEFVDYLVNHARGAAYPAVTGMDFEKAFLLVPPAAIAERFDTIATPTLTQINLLHRRNEILRRTRDLLLPRLLSGEIDVSSFPEPAV